MLVHSLTWWSGDNRGHLSPDHVNALQDDLTANPPEQGPGTLAHDPAFGGSVQSQQGTKRPVVFTMCLARLCVEDQCADVVTENASAFADLVADWTPCCEYNDTTNSATTCRTPGPTVMFHRHTEAATLNTLRGLLGLPSLPQPFRIDQVQIRAYQQIIDEFTALGVPAREELSMHRAHRTAVWQMFAEDAQTAFADISAGAIWPAAHALVGFNLMVELQLRRPPLAWDITSDPTVVPWHDIHGKLDGAFIDGWDYQFLWTLLGLVPGVTRVVVPLWVALTFHWLDATTADGENYDTARASPVPVHYTPVGTTAALIWQELTGQWGRMWTEADVDLAIAFASAAN